MQLLQESKFENVAFKTQKVEGLRHDWRIPITCTHMSVIIWDQILFVWVLWVDVSHVLGRNRYSDYP